MRQRKSATTLPLSWCVLICALAASNALAQDDAPDPVPAAHGGTRDISYFVSGGIEHQFQTDTDAAGDFSLTRFYAGLNLKTEFTSEFSMSLQIGYDLDSYDFNGLPLGPAGGTDPWDDIHTVAAGAIFTYQLNNSWGLFGGPVVQFSRESGADWGDSVIGGGILGATYHLSSDLTLGGGLWVVTQIEDDARIFPIIVINWQITHDLRIANQTTSNTAGRTGVELVYSAGHNWEFALGAASQFSRFRLDGDGVAPDGVGQDESTPLWFRASYDWNANVHLDALAGINMGGELRLEDGSGHHIANEDYDSPFFLGFNVRVRF